MNETLDITIHKKLFSIDCCKVYERNGYKVPFLRRKLLKGVKFLRNYVIIAAVKTFKNAPQLIPIFFIASQGFYINIFMKQFIYKYGYRALSVLKKAIKNGAKFL